MDRTIKPAERIRGEITLPGDKSISHRVVFIGGIANGKTAGRNFLGADDCLRSISAFREMGISIDVKGKEVSISGKGLTGLKKPEKELYLGNSGTTMRILPGILAGQSFEATLTGDESLSKRPMTRVIEPLAKMGIAIRSERSGGFPPLVVKGGAVKPVDYATKVASAQVKSCVLFAGLYADGITNLAEPFRSRDHTERMLEFCGAKITKKNHTASITGRARLDGKEFFIPGDISSAAFFIAAACILEGSDITIRDVGLNPTRLGFVDVLSKMGADITIENKKEAVEPFGDIRVRFAELRSAVIIEEKDIPLIIDEVPILAVVAAASDGKTVIKGAGELRVKETDRIFSLTENLKRMGADTRAENGNIIINGIKKRFSKAALESFGDHRTAMSMAIAALGSDGDCELKDAGCVNTSFPEFFDMLEFLRR